MSSFGLFRSIFSKKLSPITSRKTRQSRCILFETLESRFVPTVSAVFSSGLLAITGDSNANDIDVTYATVSSVDYLIVTSSGGTIFDGTPTGSNIAASAVNAISIDAGDGNDSVDFSDVTAAHGFSGISDETSGIDNKITINGGNGADTLVGSAFGDIINGGTGNDSLSGGAGNDLYAYFGSSLGNDLVTEVAHADADWLYFGFFGSGVTIDLSSTSAQSIGGSTTITLSSSTGIENLVGSGFSDSLSGNSLDNSFQGSAGNDTLIGGAGNDSYIFHNGDGSDTVTESADSDFDTLDFSGASSGVTIDLSSTSSQTWVSGSSITLSSTTGIEAIIGGSYADSLTGNSQDNLIYGGAGNDTMAGLGGNDTYLYDYVASGTDSITEAANLDFDRLDFSTADVGITIDISSTSGQSWGDGNITLSNTSGIEDIIGSDQADSLTGNSLKNYINGGAGNDTISGGSGDDYIIGDAGNDIISGGSGNDYIIGDVGDDSLQGGAGNDEYVFSDSDSLGSDVIDEASSSDADGLDFSIAYTGVTIDLSSTSPQDWGAGTLTFTSSTGIENVFGSAFSDSITGNTRSNYIYANGGDDTVVSGNGNDVISGGDGNDSINAGDGADTIFGGMGDDTLVGGVGSDMYEYVGTSLGSDYITEASSVDSDGLDFTDAESAVSIDISSTSPQVWGGGTITLSSADGIERVGGSAYSDSLTGNALDNIILGGAGNDTIVGGDGNDILYGDVGQDSISGGVGRDAILGGEDNDIIQGGDDEDIVAGGNGADTLSGNDGSDIIIAGNVASPFGDAFVLLAIAAVDSSWASASSYMDRVGNVTGDSMAPSPLSYGFRLVKNETVLDDDSADSLIGGSGNDLFFYDNGEDVLSDNTVDEVIIDIG